MNKTLRRFLLGMFYLLPAGILMGLVYWRALSDPALVHVLNVILRSFAGALFGVCLLFALIVVVLYLRVALHYIFKIRMTVTGTHKDLTDDKDD